MDTPEFVYSLIFNSILLVFLMVLVGMASSVFLGLTVYYDSQARHKQNSAMWGVLSGFFNIAALIYIILRATDRQGGLPACPRCSNILPAGMAACPVCGLPAQVTPPELVARYKARSKLFFILFIVTYVAVFIATFVFTMYVVQVVMENAIYYS